MKIKSKPDAIDFLLAKLVEQLPVAAQLFLDAVESGKKKRPDMLEEMHRMEQKADEQHLKFLDKVGDSFITPYDREDLFAMAESADDFIDTLDHALDLVVRFELGSLPTSFEEGAYDLVLMAEKSVAAVELIKKPKKLRATWQEISDLENTMDVRYNETIAKLYSGDFEVFEALRLKNVADAMEKAADTLDVFARSLARTAIKE